MTKLNASDHLQPCCQVAGVLVNGATAGHVRPAGGGERPGVVPTPRSLALGSTAPVHRLPPAQRVAALAFGPAGEVAAVGPAGSGAACLGGLADVPLPELEPLPAGSLREDVGVENGVQDGVDGVQRVLPQGAHEAIMPEHRRRAPSRP